jgi:hypothetical protein
MARRRSTRHEDETAEVRSHRRAHRATDEGAAPGGNGAPDETSSQQTMERAEEMVDQMGERIGHYATLVGHGLLKLAARAREEAEDIWAEAQNIRRGGRS